MKYIDLPSADAIKEAGAIGNLIVRLETNLNNQDIELIACLIWEGINALKSIPRELHLIATIFEKGWTIKEIQK